MTHSTTDSKINLSRRQFIIGSVASSLVMAFAPTDWNSSAQAQTMIAERSFSPTIWFEIQSTGQILVNITRAEMGQHIGTALAQIIADELGANWEHIKVQHVDTDPKWGYMVTGGSWSVFQSFVPLSQAGAAGRQALITAGAELLKVDATQCRTTNSQVIAGDRSISFADIVQRGNINQTFSAEQLAKMPIKSPQQRTLIGEKVKALDIPAKTNGQAKFGIDSELPNMIYARPVLPPTRFASVVTQVDDSQARTIDGYLGYHILQDPSDTVQGWITVTATNYPSAIKAADALKVTYQPGATHQVNEEQIQTHGDQLLQKEQGVLFINQGDITSSKQQAQQQISATYRTATASHFQLEPLNALVEERDGHWHVHTGNQWQSLTLPTLAKAAGVSEAQITMHQYFLGGGFGRRLFGDWTIPALLTAKATKRPVKLIFTRYDDSLFDQPRSPSVQQFSAYFNDQGELDGIDHAITSGWPTLAMAPGFMPAGVDTQDKFDPFSTSGADHWYDLANHRVRVANNDLAQRTFIPGWLRAVGPGWIAWGVESFLDEVAHQQRQDPISFRLNRLTAKGINAGEAPHAVGGAKRLAATLKRLQAKLPATSSLDKDEGIGIALSSGQERHMPTWIACGAQVKVNRQTGAVTVKKITMVADAGTVVHPDGALAQLEGSIMWGVSLALHEHNRFVDGNLEKTNLDTYTPLRMADIPDLDIEFMPSTATATGLGEPGVIAVAPAIGNAIFAAVGVRIRDLPITDTAIKQQLATG